MVERLDLVVLNVDIPMHSHLLQPASVLIETHNDGFPLEAVLHYYVSVTSQERHDVSNHRHSAAHPTFFF